MIQEEKEYRVSTEQLTKFDSFLNDEVNYNQEIVFYLDFTLPSNKERFFVVDPIKDSIIQKGLVTHGSCSGTTAKPGERYANTPESYCSSLGKYKVGTSYQGKFGLAYKLHGLDSSNSNAFERFIVLHAHGCVPDEPVKYEICLSQGCPTVSPDFLNQLADFIDQSKQPILLWIEESK